MLEGSICWDMVERAWAWMVERIWILERVRGSNLYDGVSTLGICGMIGVDGRVRGMGQMK